MLRLFVAISFSSSIIFCFKFSFSLIRSSDRFLSFSNRSSMHWTGFRFLNCCFSSWIALHTFSSFSGFAIASLLLIKPMHVFCVLSFRFVWLSWELVVVRSISAVGAIFTFWLVFCLVQGQENRYLV